MNDKVQTFGIGDTLEIETPDGMVTIKGNPKVGVDDLGTLDIATEKARIPKNGVVCNKCGKTHPPDKPPICFCNECGKVSRIVRAGQCVECAYKFISEHAVAHGISQEDVDNLPMFNQYIEWKKKEAIKMAEEGMPWEK